MMLISRVEMGRVSGSGGRDGATISAEVLFSRMNMLGRDVGTNQVLGLGFTKPGVTLYLSDEAAGVYLATTPDVLAPIPPTYKSDPPQR